MYNSSSLPLTEQFENPPVNFVNGYKIILEWQRQQKTAMTENECNAARTSLDWDFDEKKRKRTVSDMRHKISQIKIFIRHDMEHD